MTRKDSLQRRSGRMISAASAALTRRDEGSWFMRTLQKKARKRKVALEKQGGVLRRPLSAPKNMQPNATGSGTGRQEGNRLTDLFGLLSAYGKAAPPTNEIRDAVADAMTEQDRRSRSPGPTS